MSSLFTRRKTDLVKGFAILFMYIHHFYLDPSRYEGFPIYFFLGEEFVNKVAVFMKICVAMFMFLSGYGMYLSAQKKQGEHALALYSIKRYIKLIFSFFFIFWLVQLIFYPTMRWRKIYGTSLDSLGYFLIDMFGLAHLFHTPTYLGTWWYISLISLVIFTFPILFRLFDQRVWLYMVIIVLIQWIEPVKDLEYVRYLPAFSFGMLFARYHFVDYFHRKIEQSPHSKWLFGAMMGFVCILCFYFRSVPNIPIGLKDGLIVSYIISFIVLFIPDFKIGVELGKRSMSMFLTHTLVRTTFFKEFSYGFYDAGLNLLVFTLVTYMIALAIDEMKVKCGYDRFVDRLIKRI